MRTATKHISFDSSRRVEQRIRRLRIDWLRSVRDIAAFLLRMRSNCDCAIAHAQTKTNDMRFEAGRRFVPEIASAHAILQRNTYHSIRLDELNKNPSTAHRLVEICSRYRRFSTAHAQLPNSSPIFSELADSGAERRDESNEVCLVAGRRFVPEISSFYYCACAATAN